MFDINKTFAISIITTIVILMFTLSYMSHKIIPGVNDNVTMTKINNENKINQLEETISQLQLRVTTLENEINSIKSIVTPTPTPTIVNTPSPTPNKAISNIQEKIKSVKNNSQISSSEISNNVNNIKSTRTSVYQKVNTNIDKKSGLSSEEINKLLKHIMVTRYNNNSYYKLLGKGEAFIEMENKYEVNTLYAISVAITETSMGTAGVGRQNNLFAFINKNGNGYRIYDSVDNSIMDFGRTAREYYFNRSLTTVNKIAPVYCPPNSTKWSGTVNWLISHYSDNINKILQN